MSASGVVLHQTIFRNGVSNMLCCTGSSKERHCYQTGIPNSRLNVLISIPDVRSIGGVCRSLWILQMWVMSPQLKIIRYECLHYSMVVSAMRSCVGWFFLDCFVSGEAQCLVLDGLPSMEHSDDVGRVFSVKKFRDPWKVISLSFGKLLYYFSVENSYRNMLYTGEVILFGRELSYCQRKYMNFRV